MAGCAEGLIHRYFQGKAGLLLAIVQSRISQEVSDISAQVPLADNVEDEIRRLVRWEVERMWADRDFLKIVMPRALLDPAIGRVVNRMGPERRCEIISARLKTFKKSKTMLAEDIRAIAEFVGQSATCLASCAPYCYSKTESSPGRLRTASPTFSSAACESPAKPSIG